MIEWRILDYGEIWFTPGRCMDEQTEFLKLIAARLEAAAIPYMLTGSMAMAIYALPRSTRDVDLVIELRAGDANRIARLFSEDCYIDEAAVDEAIRTRGMFNIIHNDWIAKADFIVRKNGCHSREEFTRRRKVAIAGTPIYVVTPEDLVLAKLAWSKESASELQLRDVRQVLGATSALDWDYLQEWSKMLHVEHLLQKAKPNE